MTGNINKNPVADSPTTQPGKEKKQRSKFSAQASKRIEDLFTDLDQAPPAFRRKNSWNKKPS